MSLQRVSFRLLSTDPSPVLCGKPPCNSFHSGITATSQSSELCSQPLLRVLFGYGFNQPVFGVLWPASLYQLFFGDDFAQQFAVVVWPASLQVEFE